jgi:hypothetical protein
MAILKFHKTICKAIQFLSKKKSVKRHSGPERDQTTIKSKGAVS